MQSFVKETSPIRENILTSFDPFLSTTTHRIVINIRDMPRHVEVIRIPRT